MITYTYKYIFIHSDILYTYWYLDLEGYLFLLFFSRQVLELFLGSWFYTFLLLCCSASLLFCFSAFCFSCFSAWLLLCFTCFFSFLLLCFPCFSAFLLLRFTCFFSFLLLCFPCFSAFLLLRFTCFFSCLLLCFPCFSAFLLLCFCAFLLLLFDFFLSSVICLCCSTSCSSASLLPVSTASLFFSFLLLYSLLFVNTLGETQRTINPDKNSW